MFSIEFENTELSEDEKKEKSRYGIIRINSFEERFLASVSYWSKNQYMLHWVAAIKRILSGENISCLISSMHNPTIANFINVWAMYMMENRIVIQNHILIFDELEKPFDENAPHLSLPVYENIDEDGDPVSEWETTKKDLEDFLKKINAEN